MVNSLRFNKASVSELLVQSSASSHAEVTTMSLLSEHESKIRSWVEENWESYVDNAWELGRCKG